MAKIRLMSETKEVKYVGLETSVCKQGATSTGPVS